MQFARDEISRARQQRLIAWQPNLTFPAIFYPSLVIGVIFTFVGGLLLYASYVIDELEMEYSGNRCIMSTIFNFSSTSCDEFLKENLGEECSCEIFFTLPYQFEGKLYFYYKLTNFYQNHRKYVNSYDAHQIAGRRMGMSKHCRPFLSDPATNLTYAPCGSIANSMFNDTFSLYFIEDGTSIDVPILRTNIAWDTDRSIRFKNPSTWEGTKKPPNWKYPVFMLDTKDPNNNGYQNEALMVWMRTAAFPSFVKLYGRIDHDHHEQFKQGLPGGSYKMSIKYNYPTFPFDGTKSIFLTNLSWLGSKNYFLGVAYVAAGLQFVSVAFLCILVMTKYAKSFRYSEPLKAILVSISRF